MANSRNRIARRDDDDPRITRLHEIAQTGPARIGADLRAARQREALNLADVAARLRIGQPYLQAMEEGRFEDLPGRTYAVGFLRTYANFIGLDGERFIERYRDEVGAAVRPSELNFPEPMPPASLPTGRIVAIALALAVIVFGGWSVVQDRVTPYFERVAEVPADLADIGATTEPVVPASAPEPAPAATTEPAASEPAIATIPAQSAEAPADVTPTSEPAVAAPGAVAPTAPELPAVATAAEEALDTAPEQDEPAVAAIAPEPTVAQPEPQPTEAEPGYVPAVYGRGNDGRIEIRATRESWVQVGQAEGGALFTRILRPGDVYHVPDRAGLTLRTGNAGGLEITVDGVPVPAVGAPDEVKRGIALDPERLKAGTAAGG